MPPRPMHAASEIKQAIESLLFVAEDPLSKEQLVSLLKDSEIDVDSGRLPQEVEAALASLHVDCAQRAYELVEVGSGYRFQVRSEHNKWVARLLLHRPRRYSRALLETLALIAYRQPITRGEIEQVRGVAVSTQTMRTLLDRGWVRELGVKDLPGRPMMYGTTSTFLDYFSLRSLEELPPLRDIAESGSGAMNDEVVTDRD
ncbi:MAG: SMC-Scp complex subunit ScpB [Gammaproteobacteria bacterium]|nr:SMC-Scp complex subunit ScpB [Gammaproteobacteria bacterium]